VASAAKPVSASLHHAKAHQLSKSAVNRASSVLYDQSSNDSGIGIVSQNFESSFDIYDSAAADDFTVPKGSKWTVSEVDAFGVYFNGSGPANSEHVTVYKNKRGLPGKMVADYAELSGTDSFGSFVIALPGHGLKLKAGTYWLSVVANLDFSAGGEWGWENQSTVEGMAAVWENPGDGFATGCTTWTTETTCIADGQGDHMFTLRGKSKG
jgi:hypothetical protein